jgi:hypothetical protein
VTTTHAQAMTHLNAFAQSLDGRRGECLVNQRPQSSVVRVVKVEHVASQRAHEGGQPGLRRDLLRARSVLPDRVHVAGTNRGRQS